MNAVLSRIEQNPWLNVLVGVAWAVSHIVQELLFHPTTH